MDREHLHPLDRALALAPIDDEPDADDADGGLTEASLELVSFCCDKIFVRNPDAPSEVTVFTRSGRLRHVEDRDPGDETEELALTNEGSNQHVIAESLALWHSQRIRG